MKWVAWHRSQPVMAKLTVSLPQLTISCPVFSSPPCSVFHVVCLPATHPLTMSCHVISCRVLVCISPCHFVSCVLSEEVEESSAEVEVVTLLATSDYGILMQVCPHHIYVYIYVYIYIYIYILYVFIDRCNSQVVLLDTFETTTLLRHVKLNPERNKIKKL
jgi:hypothetical protein